MLLVSKKKAKAVPPKLGFEPAPKPEPVPAAAEPEADREKTEEGGEQV